MPVTFYPSVVILRGGDGWGQRKSIPLFHDTGKTYENDALQIVYYSLKGSYTVTGSGFGFESAHSEAEGAQLSLNHETFNFIRSCN